MCPIAFDSAARAKLSAQMWSRSSKPPCVRLAYGIIETRPGDDDPGALALMPKLSIKSRKRWREVAPPAPAWLPGSGRR